MLIVTQDSATREQRVSEFKSIFSFFLSEGFSFFALLCNLVRKMSERKKNKWKARTKLDLIIEAWEQLDCETVGAQELEQIAQIVREEFGAGAVESPMRIARLLADEGAELRHAEILEMDARARAADPYEAMFRQVLKFADFAQAQNSLRQIENLRKQFIRKKDKEGLRRLRELALKGKRRAEMIARNRKVDERKRAEKAEIAEWFAVWLRQPEIFNDWVELRRRAKDFGIRFGDAKADSSST